MPLSRRPETMEEEKEEEKEKEKEKEKRKEEEDGGERLYFLVGR